MKRYIKWSKTLAITSPLARMATLLNSLKILKHTQGDKDDVKSVFNVFFRSATINASLNETYIYLIQKKLGAKRVGDYKPIILTSCLYKIIARVLSERLKLVLPITIF